LPVSKAATTMAGVLAACLVAVGCSGKDDRPDSGALQPGGDASSTGLGADAGQDHGAAACGATGARPGSRCYSDGMGACITEGKLVCMDGATAVCPVQPGTPDEDFHTSAAPNGSWDWNCNNNVDRKYPLKSCDSFGSSDCPAQGWSTMPGASGDCGEQLIQQACAPTGSGCQANGPESTVTEACK